MRRASLLLLLLYVPRGATQPLLPGGVADPTGRTGFLINPQGGIDAVDLVSGDLLWSTTDARRPLLVHADRLIALAVDGDTARIRIFDHTQRGTRRLESEPLELPLWALAGDTVGRSVSIRARMVKGELRLSWDAHSLRDGQHTGAVAVDTANGKVTARPVETSAKARTFERELQMLAVRWQGIVGNEFRALVLEEEKGRQTFVLHSWDLTTGKANATNELLTGRRLMFLPTVDDRYLCLRDGSAGPEAVGDSWSVFAVDTGELVSRVPFAAGTQSVALLGPRVFFLISGPIRGPITRSFQLPRSLRAVDVKTGKTLWERPVEGKSVPTPLSPRDGR
jgi:hypothetical protein